MPGKQRLKLEQPRSSSQLPEQSQCSSKYLGPEVAQIGNREVGRGQTRRFSAIQGSSIYFSRLMPVAAPLPQENRTEKVSKLEPLYVCKYDEDERSLEDARFFKLPHSHGNTMYLEVRDSSQIEQ